VILLFFYFVFYIIIYGLDQSSVQYIMCPAPSYGGTTFIRVKVKVIKPTNSESGGVLQ